MTLAVAQALIKTIQKSGKDSRGNSLFDHEILRGSVIASMRDLEDDIPMPDMVVSSKSGYGQMTRNLTGVTETARRCGSVP
jgi:hypothetical protein